MSVVKGKRDESSIEFLDNALKLEIYTIKVCTHFPKRYFYVITRDLIDFSKEIYSNVKAVNSIFPKFKEDFILRRKYLIETVASCQKLLCQLNIAKELISVKENKKKIKSQTWGYWIKLIVDEVRLVTSLKKSDEERFFHCFK